MSIAGSLEEIVLEVEDLEAENSFLQSFIFALLLKLKNEGLWASFALESSPDGALGIPIDDLENAACCGVNIEYDEEKKLVWAVPKNEETN